MTVAICERAMQYDPNSRYQTASDLAMDVQHGLMGFNEMKRRLTYCHKPLKLRRL